MIVADASVAVDALIFDGPARLVFSTEDIHAPHLIDSEIANTLRRPTFAKTLSGVGGLVLDTWRQIAVTRYAIHPFLGRIWELRANLTAYDASYVALAEAMGSPLVTADARLGHAPGIRCPVTVVPR